MSKREAGSLSLLQKLGYGVGDLGANFCWTFVGSFIMLYCPGTLGISAGVVGSLIAISKVLDGVTDIFMGAIIDRTHSKMGKSRFWLLVSTIPLSICTYLIFNVPSSFTDNTKYIYIFVIYTLLGAVFYTMNNIAYSTLMALCTKNPKDRVQMGSFRYIFAMVAGILIQYVTVPLVEKFGGSMGLRNFTQLIGHASNVTGVPYDLHMKCLRDPSFHVNAGDFFVLPKPDKTYRGNVSLPKVIHDAVTSKRMKDFQFSLNGSRFYSARGETSEDVTQETFTDPLRAQGFSDLQIAQLADFANEAGTGVTTGLGMPSSSSVGVMDIRKDEHGNMKVRCQLASTRFNGVDLAPEDQRTEGSVFNYSLVTSTDDLVEEFTIRPDGKGTMDSIHFVQSDRPRNVVTVVDDTNQKVDREDIYGKEVEG